ncbi:MAG: AraC family transcriptional regulator [Victivallaceae bacterium]|jgi:AraC-like DNA-binding protein
MSKLKNLSIIKESYRQQLCHPENWKLVCSLFPPDIHPIANAPHKRWLEIHPDSHPQQEILFALAGDSQNSLNQRNYPCPPDTIFLFDSYEEHDKNYPADANNIVHFWLYFIQHRIIARLVSVNNGRIELKRKDLILENGALCEVISQEWGRLKHSPLDANLKRKKLLSLLSLLFIELIEMDMAGKAIDANSENHQEKTIRAICQHIINTSGKGLTIEKLARIAGYSKFHFLRVFKKRTGQSIHDYINVARLQKVETMLAGNFLLKEISEELGFSSPTAFSHWYRQQKNK